MITRRQIRIRVMQAIYAMYSQDEPLAASVFDQLLKDYETEIRESEKSKDDDGDSRLLHTLYYDTIKNRLEYDQLILGKAQNWKLDRIAMVDRILLQMGISEMIEFEEIPVKVSINEYLEIAKKYSTPKSSKFINGILDTLHGELIQNGRIKKTGRGLLDYPGRSEAGEGSSW